MRPPAPAGREGKRIAAWLRGSFLLATAIVLLLPAFAGGATYVLPGFSDTAVVTTLSGPTDFIWTPDGRMLILEKAGRVRIVVGGVLQAASALDLVANTDSGFEKGFLGICLHPNFTTNGYVFLYYTRNSPTRNRIARFTMTGNTLAPGSEVVILDNISAQNGNHNGGTILIGPDGKLWAAPGDSGTGGVKAQNLSPFPYEGAFSGKVLRMELDGSPAAGNPFLGDTTKEQRIFAYGFRNPFRFSFRPSNGALFAGDVGQSSREEIDVVTAGGNFGWPMMEGNLGTCPSGTTCIPPVFDYPRSVGGSITGGVFVTGSAYPALLQGKYVFGDYVSNTLKFLDFNSSNVVVGGLQDLATAANGPVAFKMGPDSLLYYAAINNGRIYRINPPPPPVAAADFFTLTPCRAADTRNAAGPYGGPALAAGGTRTFVLLGRCLLPATALAVSVNVTVVSPSAAGFLTLFPTGQGAPSSSTINFRAGQTRANNAILTLGGGGGIDVLSAQAAVHFVLDVNGYFE